MRCAYIAAAVDGRAELRAADLGPAFELAKYQTQFRQLFSPTIGLTYDTQAANRLMEVIRTVTAERRAAGDKENPWISTHWLQQQTRIDQKYGPGIVLRIIKDLCAIGKVDLVQKGRSRLVRLVDDSEL